MKSTNIVISPPTGTANISPIGFHGYASEFAMRARQAHVGAKGRFSPVPYYLYCHSLELVLKAFLLARGAPMADLPRKRKLGHDLAKILLKAKTLGLEQTVPLAAHWEPEVHKANAYYAGKGFEYFYIVSAVKGYPDLPGLDVLNEIVTTLLAGLEQVCIAA
jgi:hypothetical protein